MATARGPRRVPRNDAVRAVVGHLDAAAARVAQPPLLLFHGPVGMGKSALLAEVHARLEGKTACTVLDCAGYRPTEMREFITQAKLGLGRYSRRFGRIAFRRLEIGLAASHAELQLAGSAAASRRTIAALTRREIFPSPKEFGTATANAALSAFPTLQGLRELIGPAVTVALSRLLVRRFMLSRFQKWYGHRDQGLKHNALDTLLELNGWGSRSDQLDRRDRRLMEAALADVRAAYAGRRRSKPGFLSTVLLLDNVDAGIGPTLLKNVAELRGELKIAGVRPAPLVLVATARTPLEFAGRVERHRLAELTEQEVTWLTDAPPDSVERRFPKLLFGLTGGYPAASWEIAEAAYREGVPESGLETLLSTPPENASQSIEDGIRTELFERLPGGQDEAPLPPAAPDGLTTCAMARTAADARWLLNEHVEDRELDDTMVDRVGLWAEDRTAAHDLLRTLLLRELARRTSGSDWTAMSGLLRAHAAAADDLVGELYYALALGDVATVAIRLGQLLPTGTEEFRWLDLLRAVASAPRRAPVSEQSPFEQQVALVGDLEDPRERRVAHVVAGLWLAGSPGTSPDRSDLHRQIARDLRDLAPDSDAPTDLVNEAKRHERLAQEWA